MAKFPQNLQIHHVDFTSTNLTWICKNCQFDWADFALMNLTKNLPKLPNMYTCTEWYDNFDVISLFLLLHAFLDLSAHSMLMLNEMILCKDYVIWKSRKKSLMVIQRIPTLFSSQANKWCTELITRLPNKSVCMV